MNMDRNNTAIELIEFQNQWTSDGFYHGLIKDQLASRNVLENTLALVNRARENGIKIIHAPLIIDPKNKKGWLAHLTFGKVFTKGTWKAEITDGLFQEDDILVEGRYAFDAFVGSNFERLLNDNHIKNIFFCGFTTDHCVAKTMRTALDKGFNGYLVSDCTAARNSAIQMKTEQRFKGRVVNQEDILDGL